MSEKQMSMMCTESVSNSVLSSDHKGLQVVCYWTRQSHSLFVRGGVQQCFEMP